ncbi:MAG: dipeptidase E [Paraglaciecola sp.]|jgi:dipeptidase E
MARPAKKEIIFLKILMLSSSRRGNEPYLQHARGMLSAHLGQINEVLFIPFAGVTIEWNAYTAMVQAALPELNIKGIQQFPQAKQAIRQAKAILVGGGNTFNLLNQIYQQDLLEEIQQKVRQNTPYIGWSAGSNICGNSIRTTNDMPIVQPPSFAALDLLPVQINPHYSDYTPPGHNGETRAQRIQEFCVLNPKMPVIGIREGAALLYDKNSLTLTGDLDGIIFQGQQTQTIVAGQDLSFLLNAR